MHTEIPFSQDFTLESRDVYYRIKFRALTQNNNQDLKISNENMILK